jgi:hypothetical protein
VSRQRVCRAIGITYAVEVSPAAAAATWHAALWAGASNVGLGVTRPHISMASGQRSRKRQPSAGFTTFGGSPTAADVETETGSRGSGTAESRSCV